MELIDQQTKKIMEECKVRAKDEGLSFSDQTLEYITTNRDMIELSPKIMIPTLYDYWVHDVDVLRDKWIYDVYPHNPYETVINTRPPISFYNDNNPDWLNIMIFYHVIAHIDFMQNNIFFRKTWDDDFCGQALADKRLINRIREEKGAEKRWVDYVIEFARGIDNLVGYYGEFDDGGKGSLRFMLSQFSERVDFYFGEFLGRLHDEKFVSLKFYYDEVERYNSFRKQYGEELGEVMFFDDVGFKSKFPEFPSFLEKSKKQQKRKTKDVLHYLMDHSEFIAKEENHWMKDVLDVVRRTSLYFQPQFRDAMSNEGWASLWHERLFMTDKRIQGHEVDFANVNSKVMLTPKIGLNRYSIGRDLLEFIEELARKGKLSYDFQLMQDSRKRRLYDKNLGESYARKVLFAVREHCDDALLVNFLSDDDFQDFVDRYNLFVAGIRPHPEKLDWFEVYIKSKSGKDYRTMLNKSLYHPPHVCMSEEKAQKGDLYLDHTYEGRTLVTEYIPAVLIGLSYLWGGTVKLETTEYELEKKDPWEMFQSFQTPPKYKKIRVLYTCQDKKLQRTVLSYYEEA